MSILSPAFIRREIRHLFFVAMEIAWIATLLDFLDLTVGGPDRPATAWSLWLYPATYVYARLEQDANGNAHPLVRFARRVVIGGVAGLATLGWIVRPVLPHLRAPTGENWVIILSALTRIGAGPVILIAVGCGFAIARGWLLGPRRIDGNGFLAAFQTGIIALFAVAFLRHLAGMPTGGAIAGATLFLAFGLYGLWLSRWLDSDFAVRRTGSAGWPILAALIVGLVLGVGVMFGDGVNRSVIDWLLTPVVWLMGALGRLLVFLMGLLPSWEPSALPPPVAMPKMAPPAMGRQSYRFSEITHAIGAVMFTLSMVGLIALLILRNLGDLLRWLNRRGTRAPGIAHDASAFGFLDDLRAIIAALRAAAVRLIRWFMRLRRVRQAAPPAGVRAVRDVYARLLKWAARRGWPRPVGQTPYEYLAFLRGTVPHLEADLAAITDAYVAVRYGAANPQPDQIVAVRNGWRRIRRTRK